MNVSYESLPTPSSDELNQVRSIYEASFPPAERKPFEVISSRLHLGEYLCFAAKFEESVVAFALLLSLPNASATFLEYIAVDKAHQSQGLGSSLLHFIIRELGSKLIWEVEPPINSDADDVRNRRLRFYERLGGQLIALSTPYMMPSFERGGGVPLLLMQAPFTHQLNEVEVAALVEKIYEVAYPIATELRDEIIQSLMTEAHP